MLLLSTILLTVLYKYELYATGFIWIDFSLYLGGAEEDPAV